MTQYIVIWQDTPGQQVATTVDAKNDPMLRDEEYLTQNDIPTFSDPEVVLRTLDLANGIKFAVPVEVARSTLGWTL